MNQDVQAHNVSNHAIKAKIQGYFDGKDCPKEWSTEEYSFYFEMMFGDDYGAQQSYIQDQLSPEKVTLTIGMRAIASLMEMERARVVFTTNFDDVFEDAYAAVTGKNLSPFHLEGSYAALDALNAEEMAIDLGEAEGESRACKVTQAANARAEVVQILALQYYPDHALSFLDAYDAASDGQYRRMLEGGEQNDGQQAYACRWLLKERSLNTVGFSDRRLLYDAQGRYREEMLQAFIDEWSNRWHPSIISIRRRDAQGRVTTDASLGKVEYHPHGEL